MITFDKIKYHSDLGNLKCGICGEPFRADTDIYYSQKVSGYVCEKCIKRFSKQQIEEFLVLFNTYKGHFGQFNISVMTLKHMIIEFFDLISYTSHTDIIELNMRLRHQALLYGYTPEQLIELMKRIIAK